MRWRAIFALLLLLAAFSLHLSGDLLLSIYHQNHHLHPPSAAALKGLPPPPPPPHVIHHPHRQRHNLAIHELLPTIPRLPLPQSILLPDWDVLLLLPTPGTPSPGAAGALSCLFHNGRSSPARFTGTIPSSSSLAAFLCSLPPSLRRLRPFYTPRLVADTNPPPPPPSSATEMLRWNRLVYESLSTPTDLILLAKGVNTRQGANRPVSDLRCAFLSGDGTTLAVTPVTTSAQEVFRCPHPPPTLRGATTTVSLHLLTPSPTTIPSVAAYHPPRVNTSDHLHQPVVPRRLLCACTMVYNSAKFLREWVVYHSGIGIERFILYDNASDDDLPAVARRLSSAGHDVTTRPWPWPKTQEAGFSHCAAEERRRCTWMAFLDVDEFLFSRRWSSRNVSLSRSLLPSLLLPREPSRVGQVTVPCRVFGPSGRRRHPAAGVTQGYVCRRRAEERHKAVVRLEAVADGSLVNSVHHFGGLEEGWRTRRAAAAAVAVNHYKYQAWEEFRAKFRRRVSAYVADWTEAAGMGSKDRAPGLGRVPVEPDDWAGRFCEANDTGLRDTARRWFGNVGPTGKHTMAWAEE